MSLTTRPIALCAVSPAVSPSEHGGQRGAVRQTAAPLRDDSDLWHGDHKHDWPDELEAYGDLPSERGRRRTAVGL